MTPLDTIHCTLLVGGVRGGVPAVQWCVRGLLDFLASSPYACNLILVIWMARGRACVP